MTPFRFPSRRLLLSRPLWRRIAARAGVFALVLQVLFPVHGFAAVDGVRVPVCTGGGIVWKVLADGPETPPPVTNRLGADCPFCLFHAAAFAPAAPAVLPVPVARPVYGPHPVLVAAPVTPYVRVHPSRGPPAAA